MKQLLGIGVIIVVLRITAFWTPIIDIDESQFAGFANILLHGGLPYVDSLDTKPLGIYWLFAVIFWLFGENNMLAVHSITMLVVAATAFSCYRIGRSIASPRAGLLAALFYAIFPTCFIPKIISTSIIIIMILPLTLSVEALIRWRQSGRSSLLFASGFLLGIACLFKYQAGINLFVVGGYLAFAHRKTFLRSLLIFMAGAAVIGGAFALYLWSLGIWEEFAFWSLRGSISYIKAARALANFLHNMVVRGGLFLSGSWLLVWLIARRAKRLFAAPPRAELPDAEFLLFLWLSLSLIPVSLGGRFYGHYFLQLMPAMCIIAGVEAATIAARLRPLLLAGLVITPLFTFSARLAGDWVYRMAREENPHSYRPIGEYLRAHSNPTDRIFVWGFATPIYFFADRLPASRFLWCDWMTGRIAGSTHHHFFDTTLFVTKGSWELLFQDLSRHQPLYFVDTAPGNYHGYGKYPISGYPLLADYLQQRYTLETTIAGAKLYRRNER